MDSTQELIADFHASARQGTSKFMSTIAPIVRDPDTSRSFYTDALGLDSISRLFPSHAILTSPSHSMREDPPRWTRSQDLSSKGSLTEIGS